jgi:hypothetical protein
LKWGAGLGGLKSAVPLLTQAGALVTAESTVSGHTWALTCASAILTASAFVHVLLVSVLLAAPGDGNLRFTGKADFELQDADSDGLFEALIVEPQFVTSAEDRFLIDGRLMKDSVVISNRPAWRCEVSTFDNLKVPPGSHTARLWFSGEEIYRSGKDGPYQVGAYAISGVGVEDTTGINTPAYSHAVFGEIDATIATISDAGVDRDGDGLFEALKVTTEILVRVEGEYHVEISLCRETTGTLSEDSTAVLGPGIHEIAADFVDRAVSANGEHGPWRIVVNLSDAEYSWLDSREHLTEPYTAGDFETAPDDAHPGTGR